MGPVKGANLSPARRAREACRFEASRARIAARVAESALNAESVADRARPLRGAGVPCAPPQARRALIAAKQANRAHRMPTNIRGMVRGETPPAPPLPARTARAPAPLAPAASRS